jgi:hypothetical protein
VAENAERGIVGRLADFGEVRRGEHKSAAGCTLVCDAKKEAMRNDKDLRAEERRGWKI